MRVRGQSKERGSGWLAGLGAIILPSHSCVPGKCTANTRSTWMHRFPQVNCLANFAWSRRCARAFRSRRDGPVHIPCGSCLPRSTGAACEAPPDTRQRRTLRAASTGPKWNRQTTSCAARHPSRRLSPILHHSPGPADRLAIAVGFRCARLSCEPALGDAVRSSQSAPPFSAATPARPGLPIVHFRTQSCCRSPSPLNLHPPFHVPDCRASSVTERREPSNVAVAWLGAAPTSIAQIFLANPSPSFALATNPHRQPPQHEIDCVGITWTYGMISQTKSPHMLLEFGSPT